MRTLPEAVEWYMARATRTESGCLVGPGKHYGILKADGKQFSSHRAVFEVVNGSIPDGHVVRHSCDNPPCVEPTHLSTGTQLDNEHDKVLRGRQSRGVSHPRASVSADVIASSVAEYLRGGVSQAEMGLRLGVGATTFGRWVRAESRKDSGVLGVSVGNGSRIATGVMPCGTRAGYGRHRRAGEPACDPCRTANANYSARYRLVAA